MSEQYEWTDCKTQLPPLNEWVLGYSIRGTWGDGGIQEGKHCCIIVKRIQDKRRQCGYSYYEFGPDHFESYDMGFWQRLPDPPASRLV